MFLLDTNTLIHYFRDQGNVGDRFRSVAVQEVGIPAVVLYELEVGATKSDNPTRRRKVLDALMRTVRVSAFDADSAVAAATVREILEQRGAGIGRLDYLIAGTAIAHRATLVTHNTKEFKRIPGLKIVDWY